MVYVEGNRGVVLVKETVTCAESGNAFVLGEDASLLVILRYYANMKITSNILFKPKPYKLYNSL